MLSVLEIPRETVLSGLKLANELGGKNIWNFNIWKLLNNKYELLL
jgi:hypothetical protein